VWCSLITFYNMKSEEVDAAGAAKPLCLSGVGKGRRPQDSGEIK
jgi:hypothetical protein